MTTVEKIRAQLERATRGFAEGHHYDLMPALQTALDALEVYGDETSWYQTDGVCSSEPHCDTGPVTCDGIARQAIDQIAKDLGVK